ncbi:MAG TPA: SDR family oxidoreductase [Chitinophagales bacterium]|nr:SDR family oxidoreductase [Chitinophagales bacterium]
MKNVLILGGTMFVGRELVEQLKTDAATQLTLFNRGKTNSALFNDVNQIHGNRETADMEKIFNQTWDCIIDFSGYYPNTFQQLLAGLKGKVGRYVFISTGSVYQLEDMAGKLITETEATKTCTEAQRTSKLPDAYGEKKAEMERILLANTWLDAIIFRPGYIYGKYDWTERFYYWLYRVNFFDKMLLPQSNYRLSLTNAHMLTHALVKAISIEKHNKVYNAVSEPAFTLKNLVQEAAKAFHKNPQLIELPETSLQQHGIQPHEFPLYAPIDFMMDDNLWRNDFELSAYNIGTAFTETLALKEESGFPIPQPGLQPEKEQLVLQSL